MENNCNRMPSRYWYKGNIKRLLLNNLNFSCSDFAGWIFFYYIFRLPVACDCFVRHDLLPGCVGFKKCSFFLGLRIRLSFGLPLFLRRKTCLFSIREVRVRAILPGIEIAVQIYEIFSCKGQFLNCNFNFKQLVLIFVWKRPSSWKRFTGSK